MTQFDLEETFQNLGANVKRLRLERGMSVPALADYLHISKKRLLSLENGTVDFRLGSAILVYLAQLFRVTPHELLEKGK